MSPSGSEPAGPGAPARPAETRFDSRFEAHVEVDAAGTTAIDWLAGHTDLSRQQLKAAMSKGAVWVRSSSGARSARRLRRAKTVLKAGAAYLPVDPALPDLRKTEICADADVRLVISEPSAAGLAIDPNRLVSVDDLTSAPGEDVDLPTPSLARRSYVLYTSGSTGKPKGVEISQANLLHSTMARNEVYRDAPTGFLLISSLGFDTAGPRSLNLERPDTTWMKPFAPAVSQTAR